MIDYKTPLQHLLEKSQLHPNKIFLNQPINGQWQEYSWAQVEQQARCIATGLASFSYPNSSRIGILAKNCAEWFIADLAIMMAGFISVPIYTTANQKTIQSIIQHSQIKAIFIGQVDDNNEVENSIDASILTIALPYPTLKTTQRWSDWIKQYQPLTQLHVPHLNDTASIIYTSGTTGEPKGVVLSYKNWAAAVNSTAQKAKSQPGDRCVSYLPLAHITERSIIEGVALQQGLQVFFIESIDTFIENLRYAKPNLFLSVPRLWSKFKAEILQKVPQKRLSLLLKIPLVGKLITYKIRAGLGLQHARIFGSGTAPIAVETLKWYQSIGINISEGWGMTETSGLSCSNMPFIEKDLGSIGKPISCVEMRLSDESEILIRGDSVFKTYYLNPKATEKAFSDGWFHTGDCGYVDECGVYTIIGRIKEQFKTAKGKYVAPAPIEKLLSVNQYIEQVVVMGSGFKQPIALINLTDSANKESVSLLKSLQEIFDHVNQQLEKHQKLDYLMICQETWSIKNNLLTSTLKLKRDVIEDKYKSLLPKSIQNKIIFQEQKG